MTVRLLLYSLTICLLCNNTLCIAQSIVKENQIKAAYFLKLPLFISWPKQNIIHNNNFKVCLMGDDPLDGAIQLMLSKNIKNRKVQLLHVRQAKSAATCQALFISQSEQHRYKAVIDYLKNKPVLTVSDIPNFSRYGGMIQLVADKQQVHFVVALDSLQTANLFASSNLLSLAKRVSREQP